MEHGDSDNKYIVISVRQLSKQPRLKEKPRKGWKITGIPVPLPLLVALLVLLGGAILAFLFFILRGVFAPKKISHLSDLIKANKTTQAIKTAKSILQKDTRNGDAHFFLGTAYLKENKPELALMEFKTVGQIGNFTGFINEADYRKQSAQLFMRFDQDEEALKEYLLLIKLEPFEPEHYYQIGALFLAMSKGEQSLKYFKKTLELDPRHSNAHLQLGLLLYRAKRFTEAKNELDQALRLQPDNNEANYYLGKILKESNDFQGALKTFEIAARDPELKLKALVERGSVLIAMKNYDRAISELERAVKLGTDDGQKEILFARYFLSICYEKTRQLDKAIGEWEKIYAKKPTFRDVAEKLSAFQDLRLDDKIKDYVTSTKPDFQQICRSIIEAQNFSIQDVNEVKNGLEIIAIEADSGTWRNTKKMPKLFYFYRISNMIGEELLREIHETVKKIGASRAIIITNTNFGRMAINFAETRPLELVGKDKLQELLNSIQFPGRA